MKFLKREFESIVAEFEERGVQSDEYRFVKKKGWLIVDYSSHDCTFSFHRKARSKLNADMQFEELITYYVNHNKNEPLGSWDDVVIELKSWLDLK